MPDALSFLFQGSPPPATTTYASTSTQLPPWLDNYFQGLVSKSNVVAGEPYQPYTQPRIAPLNPDQLSSYEAARSQVGDWMPAINSAEGQLQHAGSISPMQMGQPYLNQAMGQSAAGAASPFLNNAGATNPLATAQPYLSQAGQTFPGQANDYMNPYIDQVSDRLGDLARRTFTEKIQPNIQDQFIRSGQFGSSRQEDITGRAVRDLNESVMGQQAQLLNTGYNQAGQLFNLDQDRQARLGQTAGQLDLQGGALQADVGRTLGGLTAGDITSGLQGASVAGNLAGQDITGSINTSNALLGLGSTGQALGTRDAATMETIGAQQRAFDQSNLDLGYQNFVQQRQYPQDMVAFLNSAIRGLPAPTSSQQTSTGPASTYSAPLLSQLAGAGLTGLSLQQLLGRKKGGHVTRGGYLRRMAAA